MKKIFKLSVLATCSIMLFGCNSDNNTPEHKSNEAKILSSKSILKSGNQYCDNSGVLIQFGEDKNNSNKLEQDEIQDIRYVCDNKNFVQQSDNKIKIEKALVAISNILPNTAECSGNGGKKVILGVDKNTNHLLDTNEIQDFYNLCNVKEHVKEVKINSIETQLVEAGKTIFIKANISNLPKLSQIVWYDQNGKIVNNQSTFEYKAPEQTGNYPYTIKVEDITNKTVLASQAFTIKVTAVEAPTKTEIVNLKHQSVYIPKEFDIRPLSGDISGAMIYANNIEQVPEAVSFMVKEVISTPNDHNEMMGFVAEKSATELGSNIQEIKSTLINSLNLIEDENQSNLIKNITELSTTEVSDVELSSEYNIDLYSNLKPTSLIEKIINQIALDKNGGEIDDLIPSNREKDKSDYKLNINVKLDQKTNSITMIVTLVSKDSEKRYQDIISKSTSESISVDKSAVIKNKTDSFTAKTQTSKSDFLFVIDNSGSMYDEQYQISVLTESFKQTMQTMGIDFQVATITTDSSELRGNGFTNDFAQIAQDFMPGTDGDPTERGIYYSEKALKADGAVTTVGYPRVGASLSIVIMSDEESQYTDCYGYDCPQAAFDPLHNLYIKNSYRVYSIVEPSQADVSQYDDLANTTNGKTLNINALHEYQAFINKIAKDSGAMSAGYKLQLAKDEKALSPTLNVMVDGLTVPRDSKNGWQYYPQSDSILFFGSAIPTPDSNISVSYSYTQSVTAQK